MSMIKYGRCDICGKKTFHLKRRYYRYSFPCGCCVDAAAAMAIMKKCFTAKNASRNRGNG